MDRPMRYGISAAIIFAVACYGLFLSTRIWRILPFGDQWDAVERYRLWTAGDLGLSTVLLAQHNEHRLVPTQLVFLIDFSFFKGLGAFAFVALLLAHAALGAALGMVATRGMARPQRLLGMAFGTAFLLSPIQIENLISPFNLQWAICPLFILAAVLALKDLPKASSSGGRVLFSLLVVVATCAGIYSSFNGLAGAVIVAALVSFSPIGRVMKMSLIASIGLSIIVFFIGYKLQLNDDVRADLLTLTGIWQFLATIPNILGAPMEKLGDGGGLGFGAAGLTAWIAASLSMLRRYRREDKLDPASVALWALSAMAIATAIMIAYGRSGQGVYIASRYDTWSAIFWVAILGMFWRLFEDRAPAVLGIGALLLTMSYVTGQGYAGTFRGRAELLDELTAELRSGGTPDKLRLIYPSLQGIERRIEFLRQSKLSIFAD